MDEELNEFDAELSALEATLGSTSQMVATLHAELRSMQDSMLYTGREVQSLSRSFGGGLRRAFDGVIFDGMRLSDALRTVAQSMVDAAYNTAIRPVQNALGGALAGGVNSLMSAVLPFERGGAFSGGRMTPFAMRGGMGLMGEAGPEAIMPLTRGADGRLGVQAQGGGRPVHVTMNITTPDVQGFQRSKSQIAAQMSQALARGQRNR